MNFWILSADDHLPLMWADRLTTEEVEATLRASGALRRCCWAAPLIARTEPVLDKLRLGRVDPEAYRADPVTPDERGLLFEIRYAAALAAVRLIAEYEYPTGVGNTTVDFRVALDPPWLIELVSLRESQAVKNATETIGVFDRLMLRTNADDLKKSDEGEMLKTQERIAGKVYNGKRAIKFPKPANAVHMLMVDARGYVGIGGGVALDWYQLTLGASVLPPEAVFLWTNPTTGVRAPISGLFEPSCPLRAAAFVQERVHVIGFVCEETFARGEIRDRTIFAPNPLLVAGNERLREIILSWPLWRRRRRSRRA